MTAPPASPRTTMRVARELIRRDPSAYAICWVQWVGFHTIPLLIGWAFKVVLDRISDDAAVGSPWTVLAVLGGLELGRWLLLVSAAVQWHGAFVGWQTVPRVNLLYSLTSAPGATSGRLPGSSGEAVSRFRDDTQDLAMVLDVWLDISGVAIAGGAAVVIMATIDARVTVAVVIPVVAALTVARWLGPRLRAWRQDARRATAEVTGFVGDSFGAVLAVKAAAAEESVSIRFREINARRAVAARRDAVGTQLVQSLSGATGEAGVGLLLLLVAPAIRAGEFTVGELGLFTSYLTVLAGLPRWAGRLGAYHRQADVSVARLAELRPDGDADAVVAPVVTHLRHGPPPLAAPTPSGERLVELRVEGLTVRHGAVAAVSDVGLVVRHGELVVLTGPVGSGKSTLLRAMLGLIPSDDGCITWNGRAVEDPSSFLVPPRAAYVPQVPRLFSEPLAETVLLGWPEEDLLEALRLACLEEDIEVMPAGVRTVVGARGVRLSGGQVQRAGAARALVRRSELLVVDDLSSALDIETEGRLWDRLLGGGLRSALVVSHRPHVLARADRVVVLDRGRVVG
ncbi:MAG TPA: ABC transporter ATP-binding protein [Acidimicrobiales bacterium]|nr:ABC transporter ATP-binding protein [Acidimicrobiales bacterium]